MTVSFYHEDMLRRICIALYNTINSSLLSLNSRQSRSKLKTKLFTIISYFNFPNALYLMSKQPAIFMSNVNK